MERAAPFGADKTTSPPLSSTPLSQSEIVDPPPSVSTSSNLTTFGAFSSYPLYDPSRKRDLPSRVDNCPSGWAYAYSYCTRHLDSYRAWELYCFRSEGEHNDPNHPAMISVTGACPPGQYCADLQLPDPGPRRHYRARQQRRLSAYCLGFPNPPEELDEENDEEDFDPNKKNRPKVSIVDAQHAVMLAGIALADEMQASQGVAGVLTTTDRQTCVNASQMEISAQKRREIFGAESWTTIEGGMNACQDCCGLSLSAATAAGWSTADRFVWRISLAPGNAALLFLAGIGK